MKASQGIGLAGLTLGMLMGMACGHQSSVPVLASGPISPSDGARLPFDREAQSGGISPTSSVVPPGAQAPTGTPMVIRLRKSLTSARAHSSDTFSAVLDEPIVVNDRVVAEQGTNVTGRVVEAKSVSQSQRPGYMRLTLSSMSMDGKLVRIRTSSTFFKGADPKKRLVSLPADGEGSLSGAVVTGKAPVLGDAMVAASDLEPEPELQWQDAKIGPERRLKFRLIEPLPIHP
jgi:hypothetical protein